MEEPGGGPTEQQKWEEEHLHAALLKFGAKDAKARKKVRRQLLPSCVANDVGFSFHPWQDKDYEYIMDEEIEFVQALKMPGTRDEVSLGRADVVATGALRCKPLIHGN